jgi:hypothetical protein
MRLRTAVAGAVAVAAVAAGGLVGVGPDVAGAQSSDDTIVTFTIAGEGLTITAPESAALPNRTIGAANTSGQLGNVRVDDRRGNLLAGWTATVSSTNFVTGGGVAASGEVIDNADITYAPGLGTPTGVIVPAPSILPGNLDAPRTAMTATGGVGITAVTWNPTLTVTIGDDNTAGTYTATVTHSVT